MNYFIVEAKTLSSPQGNFPLKIEYFFIETSFWESIKIHFFSMTHLDIETNVVYYITLYPEEL